MKKVDIYGAGISGLTAAINLVKDGYNVTVFEKEKEIGGSVKHTPSVHMTPIHFEKMKNYIGFDVEPFFSKLDKFKADIYSKEVTFNPKHLYVTERGRSKDALDYNLFKIAEDLGVNFEFSHPLTKENINEIRYVSASFQCIARPVYCRLTNPSIMSVTRYPVRSTSKSPRISPVCTPRPIISVTYC